MTEPQQQWTNVIESKSSLFRLNLKEVWQYRDLVLMFVKRDFISSFKQTILGPLWFFINPIITTIVFTLVFGGIANLPTDGIPPVLFYLAGNTLWGYFSTTMLSVSNVFAGNAGIFGKVYFPRLVTPISMIISSFMLGNDILFINYQIQRFIFTVRIWSEFIYVVHACYFAYIFGKTKIRKLWIFG
jgi:lipopolysaccharide transport system permease protein